MRWAGDAANAMGRIDWLRACRENRGVRYGRLVGGRAVAVTSGDTRPYILALDQGTTSSRAMVFDARGRVRGLGQRPLPQIYPRPGWVEHDPEAIWETQMAAAAEALAAAALRPADLAAVGIANQRETTIVWDRRTGRPVHHAIVWQCRRTAEHCVALEADGWGPAVAERTGLRLDPYFSATKVAWLLDQIPGARASARAGHLLFGTVDTWLLWRLTRGRVHATDATNASRTMLYDIHRLAWDSEIAARLQVPMAMLPEVRATAGPFGETDAGIFGAQVPITALVGDQQGALFGQGCWRPGEAKSTYGTGCFLLMHTGGRPAPTAARAGLLATVARGYGAVPADYALEGAVFNAGTAIQWLCDIGLVRRPSDIGRHAATVPDAGGAWFIPAFTGLGAPDWDPAARGALLGLTRGVTRAHLCRAVLEAVAHQCREVYEGMAQATGRPPGPLRVDGGVARDDLLMQIQADLLGVPVVRPRQRETTALGAALLAGIGAGVWGSASDAARALGAARTWDPATDAPTRARAASQWRRAVTRTLRWAEAEPPYA